MERDKQTFNNMRLMVKTPGGDVQRAHAQISKQFPGVSFDKITETMAHVYDTYNPGTAGVIVELTRQDLEPKDVASRLAPELEVPDLVVETAFLALEDNRHIAKPKGPEAQTKNPGRFSGL